MSGMPILWGYRLKDDLIALRDGGLTLLPIAVPWAMIEPHEAWAQKNHGQTLRRLADRGGLSASEVLAVLDDRGYETIPIVKACRELNARILAWEEAMTPLHTDPVRARWTSQLVVQVPARAPQDAAQPATAASGTDGAERERKAPGASHKALVARLRLQAIADAAREWADARDTDNREDTHITQLAVSNAEVALFRAVRG